MLNILFAAASRTLLTFGENDLNGTPGFLANRNRTANLNTIRHLMGLSAPPAKEMASLEEMMRKLTGTDITICPCCSKGKMQFFAEIPKYRAWSPTRLNCAAG